jgi:oligoribonuclease NrnB/cAMP/cGMP phosphodiesterase (DHH superfamily)
MKTYYNFVIFHKKCPDGFTGFYILHMSKQIHKNAIIFPDVPSTKFPPNDISNKDIIIIDVAYKYSVLRDIILKAKSVLFIDHHITIREDTLKLEKEFRHKFKTVYNDKKSGATLTWDYFFPKKKHPYFIDLIEDNDIGKWKMKNIHDFMSGFSVEFNLKLNTENINKYKLLFKQSTIQKLIQKGKIYNEYRKYLVEDNANKISFRRFPSENIYRVYSNFFDKVGQYKVALYCGSACPNASDIAKKVFENNECDFFISWVLNFDRMEYVLTLRSEKVDVGSIAKLFNGGGHLYAAAMSFKLSQYNIQDLFV